jgi:hypothetical protein
MEKLLGPPRGNRGWIFGIFSGSYNCLLIGSNAEYHGCSIYFALHTKAQVFLGGS